MKIKIDKTDALFSELIRLKRPICEGCGMHRATQVHHWKGRRYQSVRFSEENAWSLCFTCHRKFHENPDWGMKMMQKRLGIRYDEFVQLAELPSRGNKEKKSILRMYYTNEIKTVKDKI